LAIRKYRLNGIPSLIRCRIEQISVAHVSTPRAHQHEAGDQVGIANGFAWAGLFQCTFDRVQPRTTKFAKSGNFSHIYQGELFTGDTFTPLSLAGGSDNRPVQVAIRPPPLCGKFRLQWIENPTHF
jgi:hypothetical protein